MPTAQLEQQFDSQVRERGWRYHASGAVEITHAEGGLITAIVHGTEPYPVRIEYQASGPRLEVGCGCPYFQDHEDPCKHIWAALLEAEERRLLLADQLRNARLLLSDEPVAEDPMDDDPEDNGWSDRTAADVRSFVIDPATGTPPDRRPARRRSRSQQAGWQQHMEALRQQLSYQIEQRRESWPSDRQVVYIVDRPATLEGAGLTIHVACRQPRSDGQWGALKTRRISTDLINYLPDADDRYILSLLAGSADGSPFAYYGFYDWADGSVGGPHRVPAAIERSVLPMLCRTGRCFLRTDDRQPDAQLAVLRWEDDDEPWRFRVRIEQPDEGTDHTIHGELVRRGERLPLDRPLILTAGGLMFLDDLVAPFDDSGAFEWVTMLRRQNRLVVPADQGPELLQQLLSMPRLPDLELPDSLHFERVQGTPRPRIRLRAPEEGRRGNRRIGAELAFEYEDQRIAADDPRPGVFRSEDRLLILRDPDTEHAAENRLRQLGFREPPPQRQEEEGVTLELAPRRFSQAVRTLSGEGWEVEADGRLYRAAGSMRMSVSSGVDWFELRGDAAFGDQTVPLPELLQALKRGEHAVRLDDGSYGILPEQWLKQYGRLANLGDAEEDHVRFSRPQAALLDALIAEQPEASASCDQAFARLRDQLRSFDGVEPAEAPETFHGDLRPYQREGLGWLRFLQRFGFGGCLADDMGLGKTIQVLALLEQRRRRRAEADNPDPSGNGHTRRAGDPTTDDGEADDPADYPPAGPTLVVVPRSLVHNWRQEAERFTPEMRVLEHIGRDRARSTETLSEYDLILTTYGTLRRDATLLKDARFDYVILDEAQAIKNPTTASAKAARLLRGDHRLALTGTPIENHLGELWSLFEFLNPGMLGTSAAFQSAGGGSEADEATRDLLRRALRPFILRRTKQQVASELPEKLEQTLYCDLPAKQRKRYDELREYYRRSLLSRVDQQGLNRSKIQVLEALLRLRQAACHPGLIDQDRAEEHSAKLDTLLAHIEEIVGENHKALIFSQFTKFLGIVRDRLDRQGFNYEYLDGRTRKREPKIERFQNDPDCQLFLISLKAGGQGLNLTAADYVFLLDPWWNPAVEAQAIDRAHRIGQANRVFAYRLIARETVEEKVLELQNSKRELADAIIRADNNLIRNLGRDDLELLLS